LALQIAGYARRRAAGASQMETDIDSSAQGHRNSVERTL
jgi:hypothetical protein